MKLERFFMPSRELSAFDAIIAMMKAKAKVPDGSFSDYYNQYCLEKTIMSKYPPDYEEEKEGKEDKHELLGRSVERREHVS